MLNLDYLKIPSKLMFSYVIVFLTTGIFMHNFGMFLQIAKFQYSFQIVTCYIFYMVPIAIYMRNWKYQEQYIYGLFSMALLELSGYTLETSYAYPNNLLDKIFGIRNFSLVMTIFFGLYYPILNFLTLKFYQKLKTL
eukprot:gene8810-760_t